jgi:hypothetical protein
MKSIKGGSRVKDLKELDELLGKVLSGKIEHLKEAKKSKKIVEKMLNND